MKNEPIELDLYGAEIALSHIDENIPYQEWSKIGRALYIEFGDDARDVFERWSSTGSTYNRAEFNAYWKNFRHTTKVSFGSFIHEAINAGWKPEKKEYTEEEKRLFNEERTRRRKSAEKRRLTAEENQWKELKKEEQLFNSWPKKFTPNQYMLNKQMTDVNTFADVRLGVDKFNNKLVAWPIYENLFNQGRFCGFEKLLHRSFKVGQKTITKLSSDNARTDIGFFTFGKEWDCGPKRVFVVGGFADAYSAHKSSNEVVITPIGEGNIPELIKRLSKQHPDIQFIASPDNDKAGHTMIERSGGYWSLPFTDGYDWSDVYINQGADALVKQLVDIKGFKKIKSNDRYLEAKIQQGLNLLKSGMGTGKSTAIKDFIKENPNLKTLVVSHRVALAQSLKSGLSTENVSVEFYQDLMLKNQQGIDENMALRQAHVLVCSVDSLWRLAGSQWDVVFVDEVEQNLSQYFAKTIQYGEHCLNYLNFALANSQYQILADAHLGNLTFDFCHYIGLNSGVIYENEFKIAEGKTLVVYESKDHLMEEVMQQLMAKGKRYIYANSKEQVKTIATALEQERERKHYDGSVLVVHADVTKNEEVKQALQDINAVVPDFDVLIASPTLGTGFDIKSNAHQFTKTIGFLSSNVGTSEEGHQGLNRARDVKEFHVYLDPAERNEPTDPDFIQDRLIEQVSAETMKVLSIDPATGEFTNKNSLYEWLFCKVKAKLNESRNEYKNRFIELANSDGYTIKFIAKNKLAAEFGKAVRVEAKERDERVALRDIETATVHVGDMFQNVIRNSENYSAVEITKSKVNYDLHLEAANDDQIEQLTLMAKETYNEFSNDGTNAHLNGIDKALTIPSDLKNAVITALTHKQIKSRYVDSIKKLTWVNVSEATAKKLDFKDVQHSESRVSWRHLSIRRANMIKMLQVAGIDENLNYNGKVWCREQLSKRLGAWLRTKKAKDRLYKYSGITVSPNTLANPVQWLNNHLKSFGVPIISGKKRIDGKPVNSYSVDQEAWEAVRTLVTLRTQGIEESLKDVEEADFKPKTTMNNNLETDPPLPIVINKQTGQGGSLNHSSDASNHGVLSLFEGRGEGSSFVFPKSSYANLSNDNLELIRDIVNIVVNEFKLPLQKVANMMIYEGLGNFKGEARAWAGSVRDVLISERG